MSLLDNTEQRNAVVGFVELSYVGLPLAMPFAKALAICDAATKSFGCIGFTPGTGISGDCVPTDPLLVLSVSWHVTRHTLTR